MASRTKFNEEKMKPGINFTLLIPINFQICTKESEKKEWDELIAKISKERKKFITSSELIKDKLFQDIDVKNEIDLLSKYPFVRQSVRNVKDQIYNLIYGKFPKDFSKYGRDKLEQIKKEISKELQEKE